MAGQCFGGFFGFLFFCFFFVTEQRNWLLSSTQKTDATCFPEIGSLKGLSVVEQGQGVGMSQFSSCITPILYLYPELRNKQLRESKKVEIKYH